MAWADHCFPRRYKPPGITDVWPRPSVFIEFSFNRTISKCRMLPIQSAVQQTSVLQQEARCRLPVPLVPNITLAPCSVSNLALEPPKAYLFMVLAVQLMFTDKAAPTLDASLTPVAVIPFAPSFSDCKAASFIKLAYPEIRNFLHRDQWIWQTYSSMNRVYSRNTWSCFSHAMHISRIKRILGCRRSC